MNAHARALQHLLVQGFTLYTAPALVCTRLGAPGVLDTHPWAVTLDHESFAWCERLSEDDPLRLWLLGAAASATHLAPRTLCHWEGTYLTLPLEVSEVRHARARLEVAKNLAVPPPSIDGIQAIPDEVLELEMKRRRREERQSSGAKEGQAT